MKRSHEDEYAEAFRRGYERARHGFEPPVRVDPATTGAQEAGAVRRSGLRPRIAHALVPTRLLESGGGRRRKALLGTGAGVLAVALVGAAYGAGRMLAETSTLGTSGAEAVAVESPEQQEYGGRVRALSVVGASATCQSAGSVDAAGNPVTYEPAKAHDADLSTAWRCPGGGAGQRLTVELPGEVVVAEVGLVPGYAKTDPADGTDRYAQNNQITRVRWHFDDGSTFVQRISPDPSDRSMRTLRIPVTRTSRVVLEIVESAKGERDSVAISEIRLAAPSG